MSCVGYFEGDTPVHRLDPRLRIVAALVFCLGTATLRSAAPASAAGLVAASLALLARLPPERLIRRLLRFNVFMGMVCIMAPLSAIAATDPSATGHFASPQSALAWAGLLALKANAIVIAIAALLGTVEPFALGYAFRQLHVPAKLVHLYIFTVRHLDHLYRQHVHLLRAMKVRAFRPRMDLHTYRSYAYLVGVMLVRSLERSERVLDAMRCRGYTGDFHSLRQFAPQRGDTVFATAFLAAMGLLALYAWMGY